MLLELKIENFAIIDKQTLFFKPGLNIITGDTGAGKSIIIGALSLILGARVTPELVKSTKKEAIVEALFSIPKESEIKNELALCGIESGDEMLIKRIISKEGKNRVYINGSIVTLNILNKLSYNLIDISGQNHHKFLLSPESHIDILDNFANFVSLRIEMRKSYDRLISLIEELDNLVYLEKNKEEYIELLNFQLEELTRAHLKKGDEEELKEERERLKNIGKLFDFTKELQEILYEQENSVSELLSLSIQKLEKIKSFDKELENFSSVIENTRIQIEELYYSILTYNKKLVFDPQGLNEIEIRLDELNKLKVKYRVKNIGELLYKKVEIQKELEIINLRDEKVKELKEEIFTERERANKIAIELSKKRKEAATKLKSKVEEELKTLSMDKTIFQVKIENVENIVKLNGSGVGFTPKGIDQVLFLISPNPGEELKPLNKIASGGELSRMFLALKRIITNKEGTSTLVFDEVDSGIGGVTAFVIGKKLKEISCFHQVLCITHLPQIACCGDLHYKVEKISKADKTTTFVKELEYNERLEEIARMLGGVKITEKAMEHAKEMLGSVNSKGEI
jgi:DNA repair protein RecN (Recombination protein N)